MTRRRLVVLSSAFTLLGLGALAGLAVVATLKTQFGRDFARDYVERVVAPRVKGTLRVGRITGLSFGGATIDSVEIRGADDSLLVSAARVTVRWDPRDLMDKRTLLSVLEIDRPVVHLRKDSTGLWNYKRIFPPGPTKKRVPGAERGWGDYIVADSVVLRGATFILSMPWQPADSLRGAKRDSAIAYNLSREDKDIRRAGSHFERTYRWSHITLIAGYARLADPDSVGRLFQIARLDADEFDPPFAFRNIRGGVRQTGDSLWFDLSHFDLPGSTGKGSGKVVWGSDLPTRYDLRIIGDSVSLADVNWVYPTLPTTGGGSMVLTIKSEKNPSIIDYALSDMDVRTTRSRLRGDMTFAVGAPVLIVKELDLEAAPVNFDLLRTLAGGPFPYDWQGDLTGTVRGRGGPLNRFRADEARVTFTDANVPGAVTRATGSGELDILFPAYTKFRGFDVDVGQLDLRTLQYLNPNFPRLNGTVSGRATLDSLWLDVRFRNADLTHRDGPGDATRATGSGRMTIGDAFSSYDLALTVRPLSFTTLARSYPSLPLRGSYDGPMRIQGTIDDLAVTTELTGPAGTLSYDGRVDAFPIKYAARGTLAFSNLDVRTLLANDTLPVTSLNGRVELDVSADSASRDSTLASLAGVVSANLDRSIVDSTRVYQGVARMGFANGRARIDSLYVESVPGRLSARGAIGLTPNVHDSLGYELKVDSLGGLRRYLTLAPPPAASDTAAVPADSMAGRLTLTGWVQGSLDTLALHGTFDAADLWMAGNRAKSAKGAFAFTNVTSTPAGTLDVRVDTASLAGVGLAVASGAVRLIDREHANFGLQATSVNGPNLLVSGAGTLVGDTTIVRLDTLTLGVRDHRLALDRPTTIAFRPDGLVLDTLRLRDANMGVFTAVGSIPETEPIAFSLRADRIELGDVGELAQANVPFGGVGSMTAEITGVRESPRITLAGALGAPQFGGVSLDSATIGGSYEGRRMETSMALFRGGRSALSIKASIPVDLALVPVRQRMLSEALRGEIHSDSVELAILEAFSPKVVNASGQFAANLDIGGVWDHPKLNGDITIADGALSLATLGDVRLSGLNANVAFAGDSIDVEQFSVHTRDERTGTLTLKGHANVADLKNPRFNLTVSARDFHIIDRPRVAHLDVSGDLALQGSYDASRLTGSVTVERGTVFIPELIDKQVISLDNPEVYSLIDTTLTMNRSLIPQPPPALVRNLQIENVQVRMGNEVWLRSAEANINLGGAVAVTRGQSQTTDRPFEQLALEGSLTTNRGTYRLNLGIVQRTFVVESGRVQFLGDPDFNPELNIYAVHTVPRMTSLNAAQQDVRILVHIGGTLAQPRLTLSSADSLISLSETDLFSYLVTGAPSFAVSSQGATQALARSFGSYLSDVLRGGLGGFVDLVDIQLGRQSVAGTAGQSNGLNSLFYGARLGVGHQLSDRAFVSVSAGVCQVRALLGGGGTGTNANLRDLIGVKLDYRLDENLGLSAGYEPSASALLCSAGVSGTRGFAPTPGQFGFDIFRTWRF